MSDRKPGLDLLRCLALLFVVTFHSFLNNGYYNEPQKGAFMLLAGSVRWLSASCIGLFLMLTGYLKSDRTDMRSCCRGLAPALLGYYLVCAVTIPVRHFVFGDRQSLGTWIIRLLSFRAVYYGWYVGMYIGLTLLSPFINILLRRLKDRKQLLSFAGVMLVLTALPGATGLPLFPADWRSLYPLTYYILGAVIRRLQPKPRPLAGTAGAGVMALLLGAATLLSTDGVLSSGFTLEFADLWIVVIAVCLFTALYKIPLSQPCSKVLACGAGGCYGGYLLSHLLDAWCYRLVPGWQTPERYWAVFTFITVPIFLLSLLGGKAVEKLTNVILLFGRKDTP